MGAMYSTAWFDTFDAAVSAWNSLGCGTREADVETLEGLRSVLRPGGRLLLDLFHPAWLTRNERSMTWWDPTLAPSADQARFELVCVRHA